MSSAGDGRPRASFSFDRQIEASRHGNPEALGQLLEACRQYLLLIAHQELNDDLQAKVGASDLVQETFVKAHEKFDQFRGRSEEEFLAWLRQILLNCVTNIKRQFHEAAMRSVGREVPLEQATALVDWQHACKGPKEPTSSQVVMNENVRSLDQALSQLPDHYRQVIIWHHWDGCSFVEIGHRLNRSPEAARKLWTRAIEQLMEIIGPLEDG